MANAAEMILAGDVGGTNTRLTLYKLVNGCFQSQCQAVYLSADYESLEQIIADFTAEITNRIDRACIGVAGVVINGRCAATNLPWIVDEAELSCRFHLSTVRLINDLEAAAYGVLALEGTDFVELNPDCKSDQQGNRAVIAAGTGLGEAVIAWGGAGYHPFATEGGHSDFAPVDRQQDALLHWLRSRWGNHVSYERIVSGPGLVDIYRWLLETCSNPEQTVNLANVEAENLAAAISSTALAGNNAICEQALQLFVRIYAQEAGNLALKSLATGGVYLAGGIAPKILPALQSDTFLQAWLNKGRFSGLLKSISVKVVQHPQVSLLGAASYIDA